MQPVNQTNFLAHHLTQESISTPSMPFYIVYMTPNAISNNDYSNYFHVGNGNFDYVPLELQNGKMQTEFMYQQPLQLQSKQTSIVQINVSQNNQQASVLKVCEQQAKKIQKGKGQVRYFQDQEYSPKDESSFEVRAHRLSQTKNIPKNYQKAILLFISKNISYTYKVLQHCSVDFQEFMSYLQKIKKDLGSIAKLRSLWIDSENPYAKVFRIISKEYLRKHALSYIFNSRVVNISKHVKYRHIIQEGIGKPQSFTHMKEY